MRKKYDIVIVDSGLSPLLKDDKTDVVLIKKQEDEYRTIEEYEDHSGHGTAIFSIIRRKCPDALILMIGVDGGSTNKDDVAGGLIYALERIITDIKCRIVNVSLGTKNYLFRKRLGDAVDKAAASGAFLIAAFANDNSMSLPAAFDKVIGVSADKKLYESSEYIYTKGSKVNILAYGGRQRLIWGNGKILYGSGSSAACANFTSIFYGLIRNRNSITFDDAIKIIKDEAKEVIEPIECEPPHIRPTFKKCALMPVNKETINLLRFYDMMKVVIEEVYDFRLGGNVGVEVKRIIGVDNGISDLRVKSIEDFETGNIDGLIIGHIGMRYNNSYNRIKKIIDEVSAHGIAIYAFDNLDRCFNTDMYSSRKNIWWNSISERNIIRGTFGKMYFIHQPVVGIYGTSSKQGKFSLQLGIKKEMDKRGYNVGWLGTEPTSYLLGADEEYPIGYGTNVSIKGHDAVQYVNQLMHYISIRDKDIIITGGQSNVLPLEWQDVSQMPCRQLDYMLGTHPDSVVLCVNSYDETDYILRTVRFIESFMKCEVSALALFPLKPAENWLLKTGKKLIMSKEESDQLASKIETETGIRTFTNNTLGIRMICDLLIAKFAEENRD